MTFKGSERDASTAGVNKSSAIELWKEALNLSTQVLHSSDNCEFLLSLAFRHRVQSSRVYNRRTQEIFKYIYIGTHPKIF